MSEWHFMDPASRPHLMDAWQAEAEGMFELASDPDRWEAPTRAGHWQVRDVVGHIVDTTETYFLGFDAARGRGTAAEALGVRDMARYVDDGAQGLRAVPQEQLLSRLGDDLERMRSIAGDLTDDEWSGMMVPHKYMGPLPAAFYPLFQVVDYGVHSWDIREGTGRAHALDGRTADILVPLAFILWQSTPEVPDEEEEYTIGVTVSGKNAGSHRVTVGSGAVSVEEGDVESLPAVIEFDPATLVLTSYGRMNGGTARGDRELAERFLNSFFRI